MQLKFNLKELVGDSVQSRRTDADKQTASSNLPSETPKITDNYRAKAKESQEEDNAQRTERALSGIRSLTREKIPRSIFFSQNRTPLSRLRFSNQDTPMYSHAAEHSGQPDHVQRRLQQIEKLMQIRTKKTKYY